MIQAAELNTDFNVAMDVQTGFGLVPYAGFGWVESKTGALANAGHAAFTDFALPHVRTCLRHWLYSF